MRFRPCFIWFILQINPSRFRRGHLVSLRPPLNGTQHLQRGRSYTRAGAKNSLHPDLHQERVVLGGDYTPANDNHVASAQCLESLDQLRDEGLVAGSLGANTNNVYVRVDRLLSHLFWCLRGGREGGGGQRSAYVYWLTDDVGLHLAVCQVE